MYTITEVTNHVDRMIKLLPIQFKQGVDSPNTPTGYLGKDNNLTEFLKAISSELDEIDSQAYKLLTTRGISTALGVNLDNIGKILNLPRPYLNTSLGNYFGFQGATEAIPYGFGDPNNPSVGGVLAAPGVDITGDRLLLDDEYRIILLVKAIRDNHRTTHDNLIRAVKLSIGASDVVVNYSIPQSGRIEVTFSRPLIGFERVAIRLAQPYLPKSLGVKLDVIDS